MALPPHQVSNKRLSEDESASSHGDRCWKKVRPSLEEPPNANLHVVEISGDNISSSRTLTTIKENLLKSIFELSTFYDQARSTLIDKAEEIEKSESYIKSKEHLKLVIKKRDEKPKKLSVACQSLEKAGKKVNKLKALRDAAKEEAKEIESKVSAAEEEFTKCADISLETQNASNDVEQKKQVLEDSI
ncbi:hypothetical protein FXO38_19855 [Capsicum annuum]|uniref:Uncharacterized protein n=1 Tax=Capsicum annuum TaxID=4072 RepID=A0A2G2Y8R2_CAPAN|nr:hypothetical protein FXO38_19855 [Capsicum annuum]KAF3648211.1 hypothetical protein FXO37_19570 [Capsicum annuum]PHT66069.1 hypothetical protein T459_30494 [Capsicum annuum]